MQWFIVSDHSFGKTLIIWTSLRPVARGSQPPKFVVPRKICFKHAIKTKILPPKMYFAPQSLKPDYGPGFPMEAAMRNLNG